MLKMKALTLNIHSHSREHEKNVYHHTIKEFVKYVADNDIDVIAIQESSQTHEAEEVSKERLSSFVPCCEDAVVKEDNCAYLISEELNKRGISHNYTWCPAKLGYDKYDEGLAIISRHPILETEEFYISRLQDFYNWKTRKTVGAKILIDGKAAWYYSVHMGWWQDEEESFAPQMDTLQKVLSQKEENVFLMGDFNSPAEILGEGYQYVKNLGWMDTYEMAEKKDDGITVPGKIDGWEGEGTKGMRIDHIWSHSEVAVTSSKVVFSGKEEPVISDHFGVMITVEE